MKYVKLRRVIAGVMVFCMALAVLTGCGGASGQDVPPSAGSGAGAASKPSAAAVSTKPSDYATVEEYLDAQRVSGDDAYTVKVGYSGSLCEAALHMAKELGYFDNLGVNVEYVKLESGAGFAAVTAGNIDVSFALLASLVEPLANGLDAKIVSGLHTGCDKVLVKPGSGITSAADLKGKTVGVTSFTASPYVFLRRVLADNGIVADAAGSEVNFVVYSASDLPLALQNGAVDAIAMNDPTAYVAAEEYGYDVLYNSATDAPYNDQYCCSLYMGTQFIDKHPELARAVTIAMQEAAAYINDNQETVTKIQLDNNWVAAGDPAGNAAVLKTFNYIPTAQGAYDAFDTVLDDMLKLGMVKAENVSKDKLLKSSFHFFEGLPYA